MEIDARTLPDVIRRDRRSETPALYATGNQEHVYSYHRFCTIVWQTGNFLRHLGVRDGTTVAIAEDRVPQPVLALFGTALLGGIAWIGAPRTVGARAVVAAADDIEEYNLPPGGQRAGYDGEPSDPATYHFEEEVWSENPTQVPREYDPDVAVLSNGDREYTHRELLIPAAEVATGISHDDLVAVLAPLSDPRTVAAGLLAPLLVGAAIVLPDDETIPTLEADDRTITAVVVEGDEEGIAEGQTIQLADVDV